MDDLFEKIKDSISGAQHIVIIQADNPDGDSLSSALALEEIIGDLGKDVSLYCAVMVPDYLKHLTGWKLRLIRPATRRAKLPNLKSLHALPVSF